MRWLIKGECFYGQKSEFWVQRTDVLWETSCLWFLLAISKHCCTFYCFDLVQGEERLGWELRRDSSASTQGELAALPSLVRAIHDCCFPSPFRLYIEKLSTPQEKRITLAEYLQQLSRHRNFLWFVCMNLVQVGAAAMRCD